MEEGRIIALPQMISIQTCVGLIANYADVIEGKEEMNLEEMDARLASVTEYLINVADCIVDTEVKLQKALRGEENE